MSETDIDDELQAMTLANVCEGGLEQQFQARLREILVLLRGHAGLEPNSGSRFASKIKLEIEIEFDPSDGTWSHRARAGHPSRPKPTKAKAKAWARSEGLKIWPQPHQAELPQ